MRPTVGPSVWCATSTKREAIGSIIDQDWDTEFWRIIEANAVRADRIAKNAGRETVMVGWI